MDQREFTDYVIPRLIHHFPKFDKFCVERPGGVVDIEYPSANGNLQLWITTQDREIIIGFEGKVKSNDWHTHLTSYDFDLLDKDIEDAVNIFFRIINDEDQIIYDPTTGYSLFDPNEKIDSKVGELTEIKPWSKW